MWNSPFAVLFLHECTMGNHWEAEIGLQAAGGPEDYLGPDD